MVVRMRANRSHTGNRRSHHALTGPRISVDSKTGIPHQRHRVCLETGNYRGMQILDVAGSAVKQAKKVQAKLPAKAESKPAKKEVKK